MNNFLKLVLSIAIALTAVMAYQYFMPSIQKRQNKPFAIPKPHGGLKRLTERLGTERIVKVTEHVYVAIGYSLGNMILLEGTDGMIIVDTTESASVARKIFKEFRKITQKPLKGIVITHFHGDHITGAQALIDDAKDSGSDVRVFTHSTTAFESARYMASTDTSHVRTRKQFGLDLIRGTQNNSSGAKLKLDYRKNFRYDLSTATDTFDTEKNYTLAGITFTLLHTPGETDDQITVWIPDWRVVLPADNIYEAFPNLYAIRGTPPRSYIDWYRSLDKVRHLRAKYMVPSHTNPVEGEEEVYDVITHYRDAIQFINDQTIRLMNAGLDVDEIVERVQLPPSLASHPYLQQYYGAVSWSVRGVFSAQVGWFDGDPVNLFPLSKQKRAERLEKLLATDFGSTASGKEKLLKISRECLEKSAANFESTGKVLNEELQWSLELSFNALKVAQPGSLLYEEAKDLAVASLKSLASFTTTLNARNYYLMSAMELESNTKIGLPAAAKAAITSNLKLSEIMKQLPTRLIAESCDDDAVLSVIFAFLDVKETYSFVMRHCILEYNNEPARIPKEFNLKISISASTWKDILAKRKTPLEVYASGELKLEGSRLSFERFMALLVKG